MHGARSVYVLISYVPVGLSTKFVVAFFVRACCRSPPRHTVAASLQKVDEFRLRKVH